MYKWIWACLLLMAQITATAQHRLVINNEKELQVFFSYTSNDIPIISGHRGTLIKGYPENSIEAFEYVLRHTPAFFEIDPRLTKDSVIVLMHDETLERTTTGAGKLSDYTWTELQQLNLKDVEGNVTPYKIPTLAAAIEWARGKTVLNLDKKDVPREMTARIIKEMNASGFVMVTAPNAEQAAWYYRSDPGQMMSVYVKNEEVMHTYEKAGVPWRNVIAYIGPQPTPENKKLLELLHARGVMCMMGAAPVYDKLPDPWQRAAAYRSVFAYGADILESDLPVEVSRVVVIPEGSPKSRYFGK